MQKNPIALLEAYLHQHIPISDAMGVKVILASLQQAILSAPFAQNINHKKTVFGGSLHAVATLACWSLLHLNLEELYGETIQIVIASSEITYVTPVISDFKATCSLPDPIEWEHFTKMVQKKGKGRVHLHAQIFQGEQLAVHYSALFAALKVKDLP